MSDIDGACMNNLLLPDPFPSHKHPRKMEQMPGENAGDVGDVHVVALLGRGPVPGPISPVLPIRKYRTTRRQLSSIYQG